MSDELKPYYAARAAEYDRIYAKPERQADLAALRAWLPAGFAGRRVLEVACGTGYWSQFIAPVAASLHGVDAAEETLRIARARVPGARFSVGDAYGLAVDDGPHEAAFAGFWWSHVPRARLPGFLAGLGRCLVPGARVVMIDNRYVEGSSTPIAETDAAGDSHQVRRLDDGSTHRVQKNFPSADELRAAVDGHGVDVEVVEWTYFWALSYRVSEPAPSPPGRGLG
jgi:demethylmenaquinone methyltransferase/2-methoxy-6-polyprenyl-1,4-benzoquinol methylase